MTSLNWCPRSSWRTSSSARKSWRLKRAKTGRLPLISDLIFKGDVHEIKAIMAKSRELGMQTFDQHLFDLYESGHISYEDALRNADSVNELRLMIKLNSKEAKDKDMMGGVTHLNIV